MAELNGSALTTADALSLGLTNYGHFTSMRVEDGHVRGFSKHLERLTRDCRALYGAELDRDRVRHYLRIALQDIGSSPVIVRVTVYDSKMSLAHLGSGSVPDVLVTVRPAPELPAKPIAVQATKYKRDLPQIKTVGLFGSLHRRRQAQVNGFDDAIFVDDMSFISEGPTWNVGFFDGTRVIWPNAQVLSGVTMQLLKQVHDQTVTIPVHLRDLLSFEAAFVTNVSVGVRALSKIDDIELRDDHPIVESLVKEYSEIPHEKV